jgi:uncharacterized protein (TIGR00725 family)
MHQRRIIVGVIGGDDQQEMAIEIGAAVAQAGCILLTGGGDKLDEHVKNAAMHGARGSSQIGGSTRYIGVLPSEVKRWEWRGEKGLLLHTGMDHCMRNFINGVTPDALIVFGGSCGTLAEAAFGAAAGKALYFYGEGSKGTSVQRLQRNMEELSTPENALKFLAAPLNLWPRIAGIEVDTEQLLALMKNQLSQAENWGGSAEALVARCIADVHSAGMSPNTGFPGLSECGNEKQQFENAVAKISR